MKNCLSVEYLRIKIKGFDTVDSNNGYDFI